jgi:hypothetical protein
VHGLLAYNMLPSRWGLEHAHFEMQRCCAVAASERDCVSHLLAGCDSHPSTAI